jgi:Uma2 family endonuclease
MADPALSIPRIAAPEYLRMERHASCKHEFVNGIVYAMAGASRRHNDITNDVYNAILARLELPCRANTLGVQVHVSTANEEKFYYPDVVVTCSDLDNDEYLVEQPSLVVEVLSRTTEDADRGYKFDDYRKLPSFQEYVLVHQDEPKVELFRRRTGWLRETYGSGDEIVLESVRQIVTVDTFYRRVKFSRT